MDIKKIILGAVLLPSLSFAQAANISRVDAALTGNNLTTGMVNAVGQSYFQNDGRTRFAVKGGASPVTATLVTQKTSVYREGYGSTLLSNIDVSIPANQYVEMGPFPMSRWNTISGTVQVSFSSVVGVSATAIRDNREIQ